MVGISFHVGSACMDPPVYGRAILAARKLFDFAESVGYSFHLLDIGGGFPGGNSIELKEVQYLNWINWIISKLQHKIFFFVVCVNRESSYRYTFPIV